MKTSIVVAVVSVSVMLIARILMGLLVLLSGETHLLAILLPMLLALLILVGIVKGQRLAWQWGRMLGLFGAIVLTFAAIGTFARVPEEPEMLIVAVLVALQGIPLFPMFFALGTAGAREHFRAICPECSSNKIRSGNFLYTKAICRKCKATWS